MKEGRLNFHERNSSNQELLLGSQHGGCFRPSCLLAPQALNQLLSPLQLLLALLNLTLQGYLRAARRDVGTEVSAHAFEILLFHASLMRRGFRRVWKASGQKCGWWHVQEGLQSAQ
eukprot:scaffold69971_cov17-Tisochrysis_lutea.AAC.1